MFRILFRGRLSYLLIENRQMKLRLEARAEKRAQFAMAAAR